MLGPVGYAMIVFVVCSLVLSVLHFRSLFQNHTKTTRIASIITLILFVTSGLLIGFAFLVWMQIA